MEKKQLKIFTFHNVSINTNRTLLALMLRKLSLHSTMFLLILNQASGYFVVTDFTFHNVSINTGNRI